jgi:hypothetical protein
MNRDRNGTKNSNRNTGRLSKPPQVSVAAEGDSARHQANRESGWSVGNAGAGLSSGSEFTTRPHAEDKKGRSCRRPHGRQSHLEGDPGVVEGAELVGIRTVVLAPMLKDTSVVQTL